MRDPYADLPPVPSFTLLSEDVQDGQVKPMKHVSSMVGGEDVSPQLSWKDFPADTKSFAVTMYDPDAPTVSGFWHWAVVNIPASISSLAHGAGTVEGNLLPAGAFQLRNDAGYNGYLGAAPPQGHGPHRYFITVHALDVADLGLDKNATPAYLGFNMFSHTLARAMLVPVFET